jgi:hypothetical protein
MLRNKLPSGMHVLLANARIVVVAVSMLSSTKDTCRSCVMIKTALERA